MHTGRIETKQKWYINWKQYIIAICKSKEINYNHYSNMCQLFANISIFQLYLWSLNRKLSLAGIPYIYYTSCECLLHLILMHFCETYYHGVHDQCSMSASCNWIAIDKTHRLYMFTCFTMNEWRRTHSYLMLYTTVIMSMLY